VTLLSEIQGLSQPVGVTPDCFLNFFFTVKNQIPFSVLRHLALALRVRMAVADQLVAALHERFDQFGAVVVERGVDERADWKLQRFEKLEAAPCADAVAVVAP